MLKSGLFAMIGLAALVSGAPAAAEPGLQIRNAAIRLTVIPEDRADILVEPARLDGMAPVTVSRQGDQVIVEGRAVAVACWGGAGASGVRLGWLVPVPEASLPHIVVHMPRDVVISARNGAVFGQVGPTRSLRMGISSCGRLAVDDVGERLAINSAGSASIHGGQAGRADLRLAGSGDISLGRVQGDLAASVSGSGDLIADSARSAAVDVSGSGDVRVGAVREGLRTSIQGSGDVSAAVADGPVEARIIGSGDIRVRQGRATRLRAEIIGSGDIFYGGEAEALQAFIAGSGDIRVRKVDGTVERQVRGSGSVRIGD